MTDNERVLNRFAEMEKRLNERLDQQDEETRDTRRQLFRALFGDLENQPQSPGLMGRVDRLEQRSAESEASEGRKQAWYLALWSGLGALGAAEAWNWFTRKQ